MCRHMCIPVYNGPSFMDCMDASVVIRMSLPVAIPMGLRLRKALFFVSVAGSRNRGEDVDH